MVLPPGLGWSVGDVVKLIALSIKIYSAFNDVHTNSSRQYQLLAQEINRFREVLELLKKTLEDFGQSIFPYFEDVKATLEECAQFLAGYDVLREKKGVSYHVKTVKWKTEDSNIARLHTEIAGHVQFIGLYIDHLKLKAQSETRQQFEETHRRIDKTQRQNEEILQRLRLPRQSSMPFIIEESDQEMPHSSSSSVAVPPSPGLGLSELDDSIADLSEFIRMLRVEEHPLVPSSTSSTSEESHSTLNLSSLSPEELKGMHFKAERMIERAENNRKRIMNLALQRRPFLEGLEGFFFPSSPSSRCESFPTAPKDILRLSPKMRARKYPQSFGEVGEPSSMAGGNTYRLEKIQSRRSFDTISDIDFGPSESYAGSYRSLFTNETGITTPRYAGSIDLGTPKQSESVNMTTPRSVSMDVTPKNGSMNMATTKIHRSMDVQNSSLELPPMPDLKLPGAMLDWENKFSDVRVTIRNFVEWDESWPCVVACRYRESGGLSLRISLNGTHLYHDLIPLWERPTIPHTAHIGAMPREKLSISFKEPQRMRLSGWNYFEEMQPKYTFSSEWDHKIFQELIYGQHLLLASWNITSISSDHDPDECRSQTLRLWRERDLGGTLGALKITFFANRRTIRGVLSPGWVIESKSAFSAPTSSKKERLRLPFQKQNPRDSRLSFSSSSDSGLEEKKRKWIEIEFSNAKDRTSFLAEWEKS